MKRNLLLTSLLSLISSIVALTLSWPNKFQNDSQGVELFAGALGIVFGTMSIGWWLSIYPDRAIIPRRRLIVYSMQFSVGFLPLMLFLVARVLLYPEVNRRISYTVSTGFLVLTVIAITHWFTTTSAFILRSRNLKIESGTNGGASPPRKR